MFAVMEDFAHALHLLVHSASSSHSLFFWRRKDHSFLQGVQQGDPLAILPHNLKVNEPSQSLGESFYLDDGSLGGGGSVEDVIKDLGTELMACVVGLQLNQEKCDSLARTIVILMSFCVLACTGALRG